MIINTNLALIPIHSDEVQPVKNISNRGIASYNHEKNNLMRLSDSGSGSKFKRMSSTYSRMGNENNKNGQSGENIDLYV